MYDASPCRSVRVRKQSSQDDAMAVVRLLETWRLSDVARRAIRSLLDEAFDGDFSDDDWHHALGGWHAIVRSQDSVVAHAALVERRICVDSCEFRTGYVEAVAVKPSHQRKGLGTAVMERVTDIVRTRFDLGVLSTGEWSFYERFGWERWRGPTYVRAVDGRLRRSNDEDGGIMVLRCARSQDLDRSAARRSHVMSEPATVGEHRQEAGDRAPTGVNGTTGPPSSSAESHRSAVGASSGVSRRATGNRWVDVGSVRARAGAAAPILAR